MSQQWITLGGDFIETVFRAYISNAGKHSEGYDYGDMLSFPTTKEEVLSLLKRINVDGVRYQEVFIPVFDSDPMGLCDYMSEFEGIDELNYLAQLISSMDDNERSIMEAVVNKGEHVTSAAELINLALNLDCYDLYPGIDDDDTLGRIYADDFGMIDVPEDVKPYFDYDAYGRDKRINEGGYFAPGGYLLRSGDKFVKQYHGPQDIPAAYKVFVYPAMNIREQMAAYQEKARTEHPSAPSTPPHDRNSR